ncbi:MAG: hypothetical protein KGL39_42985 [Patescibacteria group bacterium]|nr:hypothetical protein [Patescibacteria group bacterium]
MKRALPIRVIHIEAVAPSLVRHAQMGDWWYADEGQRLHIRVVDDVAEDVQFLVALHELVEVYLCRQRGISQVCVDAFDAAHAAEHANDDEEPGDDPRAPYRREHRFACLIEHLVAHELGLTDYGEVR